MCKIIEDIKALVEAGQHCKNLTTPEIVQAVGDLMEKHGIVAVCAALFENVGDFSAYDLLDPVVALVKAAEVEQEAQRHEMVILDGCEAGTVVRGPWPTKQ